LRESVPELGVGEQAAAAVGVVDDRGLEAGTLRRLFFDEVADVGQVLDDGGCGAPADGAGNDRVCEAQAEELCRVGPRSMQVMT
jgi:hypothetical protein